MCACVHDCVPIRESLIGPSLVAMAMLLVLMGAMLKALQGAQGAPPGYPGLLGPPPRRPAVTTHGASPGSRPHGEVAVRAGLRSCSAPWLREGGGCSGAGGQPKAHQVLGAFDVDAVEHAIGVLVQRLLRFLVEGPVRQAGQALVLPILDHHLRKRGVGRGVRCWGRGGSTQWKPQS